MIFYLFAEFTLLIFIGQRGVGGGGATTAACKERHLRCSASHCGTDHGNHGHPQSLPDRGRLHTGEERRYRGYLLGEDTGDTLCSLDNAVRCLCVAGGASLQGMRPPLKPLSRQAGGWRATRPGRPRTRLVVRALPNLGRRHYLRVVDGAPHLNPDVNTLHFSIKTLNSIGNLFIGSDGGVAKGQSRRPAGPSEAHAEIERLQQLEQQFRTSGNGAKLEDERSMRGHRTT